MDILGVGEVCVDWVAVIDHFPEPDEKIDSESQNIFSGGVTANYITAAARLGAKTAFIGAIGNDEYGKFLKKDFTNENVSIKWLETRNTEKTPVNFIFVVKKGGEKVIIQSPYMHTTIPTKIPNLQDIMPKLIHSTAIYPELTRDLFKKAHEMGIKTSLDLEKQIAIWGLERLQPILNHTDIILPNKMGAMQITNTNSPKMAAKKFLEWGIKEVVITLGKDGALVQTNHEYYEIPGFNVNVVDTTGAGDTFCAAYGFFRIIKQFDIKTACLYANAASALKIQNLGARSGMPTSNQVKSFISSCQ